MTPEQLTLDLSVARTARDDGIASVEANSHEEWMAAVDDAIAVFARMDADFTVDDIRRAVAWASDGTVVGPHHDNAWGARFAAAARRGLIHRVGYRQSARPAGHARAVAVWRGSERGQG